MSEAKTFNEHTADLEQLVRQLGEKLYGKRTVEVRHG